MEYRRYISRNKCPLRDGGKSAAQVLELATTRRRYIEFYSGDIGVLATTCRRYYPAISFFNFF